MRHALVVAALLLAGRIGAQPANGWQPLSNGWSELKTTAPTGTVTTTGTLASGQVALGSGATSITGDAGCTWTGTGSTFSVNVASGTNAVYLGGGAGLFGSPTGGIGLGLNYVTLGVNLNSTAKHTWVNSSNILTGAVDLALSRPSTGLLLVEDGSGNPRDLQARTGYFGTSVVTPLVSGGAAIGTDQPGSDIAIQPKIGTGSSTPADVIFSLAIQGASGATPQSTFAALQLNRYFASFGVPPIPASDNAYEFGSNARRWATGYFGTSLFSPLLVSGPGKSGTNVAGTNNTIQAEPGTGSATGSSLIFQTPTAGASGTTAQTQATRLTLSEPAVIAAVPVRMKGYTVATLPAGTVGDTAYVTDATAPAFGVALVGGGAVVIPAFYDGANWIAH